MDRRRTEQGQTLPLVTLCLVTLMIAAALGIDVGSLAATNRRLQGLADLAAIDGARQMTGDACNAPISPAVGAPLQYDYVAIAVEKSLHRNGFDLGGDKTWVFELGRTSPPDSNGISDFTPLTGCTATDFPQAVRVRVSDRTPFGFAKVIGQDGRTSTRTGIGTRTGIAPDEGRGQFSIGSALATIDTNDSVLLNAVLGDMICPSACALSLGVASYQGLAASNLTYGALASELGFGTTSGLFNTTLTYDQILVAAADLVGPSTTAGIALLGIVATSTVAGNIKLADMVAASMASGNDAANVSFSLLDLVTGGATLANGSNFVTIPNTVVNIPGVSTIKLELALIENPVVVGDLRGASGATRQLSVKVTPTLSLSNQSLAGLNLATITGTLPITVTGGAATGTLSDVRCGAGKGLDATVAVNAATVTTAGTLNVSLGTAGNSGVLSGLISGVLGSGTMTTTLSVSGSVATTTDTRVLSFSYPAGFGPGGTQPIGNVTTGLGNVAYAGGNLSLSVPTLSLLGLPLANTNVSVAFSSSGIAGLMAPVLSAVDTGFVKPLMELFGLKLGAADVTALSLTCSSPRVG